MKFIHTADLHLGAANSKLSPKQKKIFKDEQIDIVGKLFDYAQAQNEDAIIIAGDLFHTKSAPYNISKYFFSRVEEYQKPVIYVRGNHDEDAIFSSNLPKNFIIFEKNSSFRLENCNFVDARGLTILDPKDKNVVIAHGDIFNRGPDFLDIKNFKDRNIDYLALGHLHESIIQNFERGLLGYSGCLFGNGFDECGLKGFLEVEITDRTNARFVGINSRQYHVCDVDITGLNKFALIADRVEKSLKDVNRDWLVRVNIAGTFDEDTEKYLHLLENKFSKEFFYLEIKDSSHLKIDIERYKGEQLSFKAELLKIIEGEDLTDEEKSRISMIAIEALRGEDLSL